MESQNHTEKSHYFLFSGVYVSPLSFFLLYSPTFPDTWYFQWYFNPHPHPLPSHAVQRSVFLFLEWIMTLWGRSSHSYVTWSTLKRRGWRQRLFSHRSVSFFSLVQFALTVGVSAAWENYTFPDCLGTYSTCKLTFTIKLGFKAMTAKDKVNFDCFLSLTEAIYGKKINK